MQKWITHAAIRTFHLATDTTRRNWRRTVFTPQGAAQATTEVRQHNYVNQLTQMGATAVTYDHGDNDDGRAGNGNVADDGTRLYECDATGPPLLAFLRRTAALRSSALCIGGYLASPLTNGRRRAHCAAGGSQQRFDPRALPSI